jgi:hypothetical protein
VTSDPAAELLVRTDAARKVIATDPGVDRLTLLAASSAPVAILGVSGPERGGDRLADHSKSG